MKTQLIKCNEAGPELRPTRLKKHELGGPQVAEKTCVTFSDGSVGSRWRSKTSCEEPSSKGHIGKVLRAATNGHIAISVISPRPSNWNKVIHLKESIIKRGEGEGLVVSHVFIWHSESRPCASKTLGTRVSNSQKWPEQTALRNENHPTRTYQILPRSTTLSFPSLHPHPSSMFEETCDVNTSSGLPGIEELLHQLGSQANSLPGSIWLNDTSSRNSFYI